jgi:hypothetical protein
VEEVEEPVLCSVLMALKEVVQVVEEEEEEEEEV